jgi:hypothetical protein
MIPHDAWVLAVQYLPAEKLFRARIKPLLELDQHKQPVWGQPETIELKGEEAKAAARVWLVRIWPQ